MTDFPGSNDWHGPATHRGVPEIDPESLPGEDQRRLKQAERAALTKANNIRALLRLDPLPAMLPGKVKDPLHCPLAETIRFGDEDLHVSVRYDEVCVTRYGTPHPHANDYHLSDAVTNFQCWVDHGFYPGLIQ